MSEATPYSVLDPDMLPKVLEVLIGAYLDLTPEQSSTLGIEARRALAAIDVPVDASPLEAYRSRTQLFSELNPHVDDLLTTEQRERWERYSSVWEGLTEGNRRRVTIGLGRDDVDQMVLHEWSRHYRLSPEQQEAATSFAREYKDRAQSS